MANSKFFTNTYITGSGRQNYLRADYLEDPLFTSFTFDIDFTSSPLFYTINNYDYPNDMGISEKIEVALKDMYGKMFSLDQGYDILPLYSAEFLKGDKLGFGLQQNVYMDLPLYGATEYIYMVDKRNGDGSQNDVRYDNSGSASSGGYKSYKLGDTLKEAVSESDKAWAEKQKQQAETQIEECNKIMEDSKVAHDVIAKEMEVYLKQCESITQTVPGEKEPLTEAQLQQKVKEYQQLENENEQIKRDICNWVNGELSAFRSKATALYMGNKCIQKIISYDDVNKSQNKEELKNLFGDDYVAEYIWELASKGNDAYLSKSLDLYNELETYARNRTSWCEQNHYLDDDGKSLLIERTSGNGIVTVRDSLIWGRFGKRLEKLGYLEAMVGSRLGQNVNIRPDAEAPEWSVGLADKLEIFASNTKEFTATIVETPLRYQCNMDFSFEGFDSPSIKANREQLDKYETALENIRVKLYGYENGKVCDISNPSPDSPYGQYLEAKEKYDNDAYSQAEKTKKLLEQTELIETSDTSSTGREDNEQNTSDENSDGIPDTAPQPDTKQPKPIITPQTVLDMLGFISGMRKMITEYPYIIQGVTGLDKAYENNYGIKDPYMGSGDNKIVLSCWESIDLRVSTMFNRYFNAVYDRQYRRERVPVNLRRFNCSIYVHDVRNFVTNSSDSKYTNRMLELTDMYYSAIEFKFYDCEIVAGETGNIFNDISNEAPSEMKKTNFTFTYGNCIINFVPQSQVTKYR